MKRQVKSLLSKKTVDRVALSNGLSNIKPRFTIEGLRRLTNIFPKIAITVIVLVFFLGYHPTFVLQFPPIQQRSTYAQETQNHEVIAKAFPQPINLPHPGYLSTSFSNYHPGIDIATGLGMPIRPITVGTIEEVNFGFFGYGNHVIISHSNGFKSMYAHMGKIYVKKGQSIETSNILGEVGMTGHTSGPHTHLEITYNGQYINPVTILPEIPNFPQPEYLQPVPIADNSIQNEESNLRKSLKPDFN